MAKLNSSRWGVVALAVLMLLVTMVNTSINGQKSSIYYAVWTFVGWYGYKGNLEQIKSWMKVVIVLNILVLLWVVLLYDDSTTNLISKGTKESLSIGVLVMLVPKLFLYLWCKSKLNEQSNDLVLSSAVAAPVKQSSTENSSNINEAYLNALNEFEGEKRDRALYARLFAENDGKEEVVKAKYIKQKAEQQTSATQSLKQTIVSQGLITSTNPSSQINFQPNLNQRLKHLFPENDYKSTEDSLKNTFKVVIGVFIGFGIFFVVPMTLYFKYIR